MKIPNSTFLRWVCSHSALLFVGAALMFNSCDSNESPPTQKAIANVGPEGGSITAADRGLVITVPENAFQRNNHINISIDNDNLPGSIGSVYSLETEVEKLDKPLTLSFSYLLNLLPEDLAADELMVACQRNDANYWEVVSNHVLNKGTQTLTVNTEHFSKWALLGKGFLKISIPADKLNLHFRNDKHHSFADSLSCDSLSYDSLIENLPIPDSLIYDSLGYDSLGYDSLTYDSIGYDSLFKPHKNNRLAVDLSDFGYKLKPSAKLNTAVRGKIRIYAKRNNRQKTLYQSTGNNFTIVYTSLGKKPGEVLSGKFFGKIKSIRKKSMVDITGTFHIILD